jgi:hypothetical protein
VRLKAIAVLTAVLLGLSGASAQQFTDFNDVGSASDWARTVGFWHNAQVICGVEYDPAKLEARTAEFAGFAGISVAQIKRLAADQAAQAAPHFTSSSCRHAREQAKRLDLLPSRAWGAGASTSSQGAVAAAPQPQGNQGGRWHDFFIGNTHLSFDSSHGSQLFYLSPGGKTYLFYPGNERILRGEWQWQGGALCFRYGADTYNPALGTSGGQWSCADPQKLAQTVKERSGGDPFRLGERTRVPFVLSAERTTLQALYERFGGS